LSVSFVEILKGFAPVVTMAMQVHRRDPPTPPKYVYVPLTPSPLALSLPYQLYPALQLDQAYAIQLLPFSAYPPSTPRPHPTYTSFRTLPSILLPHHHLRRSRSPPTL
jgi:hypothetical protein